MDYQKSLQRKSLTSCGKRAYLLLQKRDFPEGCVPGATDGSMPVGSVEIIYGIL